MKNRIINVKGAEVTIATRHEQDYISLTDMVRNFDGVSALIEQRLKNKDTVLFLGVHKQLNNPDSIPSNPRELKTRLGDRRRHTQTYAQRLDT